MDKLCNKCNLPKDYSFFGKDERNKDGYQATCNDCINKRRREKYLLNPEKHRERQKKYNQYALEKAKKHIEVISDTYVIAELKRGTELTTKDIREFPELIEAKRQIIKNKRLCKILKNSEKI
jgi:hypothetical protein